MADAGDIPLDAIPPPPPLPVEPTPPPPSLPAEYVPSRRLSDHGRTLMREGLSISSNNSPRAREKLGGDDDTFFHERPTTPLPLFPRSDTRKTEVTRFNEKYHAEESSSDEETFDVAQTHLVNVPKGAPSQARLELITTEHPFRPLLVPLHNPVDQSQVVPDSEKTFTKDPFIEVSMWREEQVSESLSVKAASSVDAIRKSISLSRRSLTTSAAEAISMLSLADDQNLKSPLRRKQSEKRLVQTSEAEKEAARAGNLAKQGLGSDYTLFNRDWSVLLRAKRASAHWSQLRNRQKHSDLDIFVGALADLPVATLKSAARASRLLMIERYADGGTVYTIAKEKIGAYRVFWIAEGRRLNGVDPAECRFVLIIRKGRILLKSRNDSLAVRHLSPSRTLAPASATTTFNSIVMDIVDKEKDRRVKIATGMDLVLAFSCLMIADRFERYSAFQPDETTRTQVLHNRFETDIGDKEMDIFQQVLRGDIAGTTTVANSLMY